MDSRTGSHALRQVLLACASLLAAAWALRTLVPSPLVPQVGPKLEAFRAEKDRVSHLFFGSSRVERHIDPLLFDRVLARRGLASYSFNFGVPAMTFPESERMLGEVLALRPAALAYVLIELPPLDVALAEHNVGTLRNVYWHDARNTWRSLRAIRAYADRRPWWRRAVLARRHGEAFLYRQLGFGLLPDLRRSGRTRRRGWQEVSEGRGFLPLELGVREDHERRREFLADRQGYLRRLEKLSRSRRPLAPRPFEREVYARIARRIEASGARPVFLLSPSTFPRRELLGAAAEGLASPLLAFNDPVIYPHLYAPEIRYDREHLVVAGARAYTRMLARRFAEEVVEAEGSGR